MYYALILLIVLNGGFLLWNNFLAPQQTLEQPPLTQTGVSSLQLRTDIEQTVYKSTENEQSTCYTLGPYNSEKAASLVADKIKALGLAVTMRPMRSMETLNFLVYIAPQANTAQAEQIVGDIKKFAVADVLVVPEGPYKNAISLGFFSNLNKAKRHAEYIRYLGYDARYTEQQAAREVFWLDYDEPFGANTPVLAWSAAIDKSSEVQRIPRACVH